METNLEVGEIKTKVNTLETKVDGIETRVGVIETRLGTIEGDLAAMRIDYAGLHNQLIDTQRDFRNKLTRRIDLVLETLVDTHEGMRDSDDRLTRLESKLA
jgi:chromosome segregation ATPase